MRRIGTACWRRTEHPLLSDPDIAKLPGGARGEAISCYRLYDADMPEYAFAIDLYQSELQVSAGRWLYVQEYTPPATVDRAKARARREESLSMIPEVAGLAMDAIYWRTRRLNDQARLVRRISSPPPGDATAIAARAGFAPTLSR